MSTAQHDIEKDGLALVQQADGVAVVDAKTFAVAGDHVRLLKAYQAKVHEVLDPIVEAAHRAHKVAVDQRKALLVHAEAAERTLKGRMAVYEQQQAEIRRQAELAAQRERERLEAEQRAKEAAERERLRKAEEEAQLARALEAEAAGDDETAERVLQEPVPEPVLPPPMPVFVPPVVMEQPKADGVSFREHWHFEVVNEAQIPREYLVPDLKKIGGVVRALKGSAQIPGIKVYPVKDVAVRV